MHDGDAVGVGGEDRIEYARWVLVDHDQFEIAVCLGGQRVQHAAELVGAADGGAEQRKGGCGCGAQA